MVPCRPEVPQTKVTGDTIEISWNESTSDTIPVLEYTLFAHTSDQPTLMYQGTDTSFKLEKANHNVEYSFSLVARNEYGSSVPSFVSATTKLSQESNQTLVLQKQIEILLKDLKDVDTEFEKEIEKVADLTLQLVESETRQRELETKLQQEKANSQKEITQLKKRLKQLEDLITSKRK